MFNFIKRRKWAISLIAAIAVIGTLGLQFDVVPKDSTQTIGQGTVVLKIGTAEASQIVDYTCDGTDDNIQFQGALDALPANGGTIEILAGNYDFTNGTTVTRALDNVTIIGTGRGTYVTCDGVTAIFTAGGNNWQIRDLRTDAGGLQMAATTGWAWDNVTVNATHYEKEVAASITAEQFSVPTGRTATYVVAASNATATEIAQADYVCDGTADQVQINAAIAALPASGGRVRLTEGTFYIAAPITSAATGLYLTGSGFRVTLLSLVNGANCNVFQSPDVTPRLLEICDLEIYGNKANNASGDGIDIDYYNGVQLKNLYIHDCKEDGIHGDVANMGAHMTNVYSYYNGECGANYFGEGNLINNYEASSNGLDGLVIQGDGNYWINAYCEMNGRSGAVIYGVVDSTINIWAGSNTTTNAYISAQGCLINVESRICGAGYEHLLLKDAYDNTITLNISATSETANSNAIGYDFTCSRNVIRGHIDVPGYLFWNYTNGPPTLKDTIVACSYLVADSGIYGNGYPLAYPTIVGNTGYISSGEVQTASGLLSAGNNDTLGFVWHNPENQDIFIKKIVINITNAGGTVGSHLDVGIADFGTFGAHTGANNAAVLTDTTKYFTVNALVGYTIYNNTDGSSALITANTLNTITGVLGGGAENDWDTNDVYYIVENRGVEFFDDLLCNSAIVDDSWVAADGGTQGKWILCQDTASATDGWIVGQILDANAASMTGSYYIEYVGK